MYSCHLFTSLYVIHGVGGSGGGGGGGGGGGEASNHIKKSLVLTQKSM